VKEVPEEQLSEKAIPPVPKEESKQQGGILENWQSEITAMMAALENFEKDFEQ
jgi:hypothetical protein